MKKIVALMLSVVMMISLCACGGEDKNEPSLENDDVTIDAIAVDDSYVDIENDNLALVYLFLRCILRIKTFSIYPVWVFQ